MPRVGYHALAAVHHEAKAEVYARADFGAKANGHRRRAAWHASFGAYDDDENELWDDDGRYRNRPSVLENPLAHIGDPDREERGWDPDTADPTSDKYNPYSMYSRMLAEVRASGAFAPSGRGIPNPNPNPNPIGPEIQDLERGAYGARARRAHAGYVAREELQNLTREMYDRSMLGDHAGSHRLFAGRAGRIGNPIVRDTEDRLHPGELERRIGRQAHLDRRRTRDPQRREPPVSANDFAESPSVRMSAHRGR